MDEKMNQEHPENREQQPNLFYDAEATVQQPLHHDEQPGAGVEPKPFIIDGTYSEQPQYRQTTYGSYAFGSREAQNHSGGHTGSVPPRKFKKQSTATRMTKFAAKACVFGLLAGGTMVGVNQTANYLWPTRIAVSGTKKTPTISDGTVVVDGESEASANPSAVSLVSQAAMASLVSITNRGTSTKQTVIGTMEQEMLSNGSGIIVGENDTELLVATNYHVIANSQTLEVTFINEKTASAVLKGGDEEMDLAVVAIAKSEMDQETLETIRIASLGSSGKAKVGEQVVAIGNALGYGQSVTTGIISAFRTMTFSDKSNANGEQGKDAGEKHWLQTDAAINPGNSGGALMNMKGEVIGINTVKVKNEAVEGMGYAIPIDEAMPILQDLMKRTTRIKVKADEQGYLGIAGMGVSTDAQSMYQIPAGVYITRVQENAAAAQAKLEEGDIITQVGDAKITSMTDLKQELAYYKAGEQVTLRIQKRSSSGYVEKELQVKLSESGSLQ